MQHGSGKLLQNIGADYIGRNAVECSKDNFAVCDFVKEDPENVLSSFVKLLSADTMENEIDLNDLSENWAAPAADLQDIPIGNR